MTMASGSLLAGPADVYLEDEFLVTSPIRTVPAGAKLTVGLGVEEGLKVARNTHYDEVSKGGCFGVLTLWFLCVLSIHCHHHFYHGITTAASPDRDLRTDPGQ